MDWEQNLEQVLILLTIWHMHLLDWLCCIIISPVFYRFNFNFVQSLIIFIAIVFLVKYFLLISVIFSFLSFVENNINMILTIHKSDSMYMASDINVQTWQKWVRHFCILNIKLVNRFNLFWNRRGCKPFQKKINF